jgi:tetratricopeptide (TPR) repeat protein
MTVRKRMVLVEDVAVYITKRLERLFAESENGDENLRLLINSTYLFHNTGDVCFRLGDYEKAKIYYEKAVDIWERKLRFSPNATVYNNIGNVLRVRGDYYEALHYYEKRFFSPVMISCEEEGLLTQSSNVNSEPFDIKKSIRLSVANETKEERRGQVRWQLRDADGSIIREEAEDIVIDALSSKWLERIDLPEAKIYENYVSYQYIENDETISEGTVLFCPPIHFRFVDPELTIDVKKSVSGDTEKSQEYDEITVSSKHYAKSIEIRNKQDDLILSDNFFDMNGGERKIKIIKGNADGIVIRSVYDIR